ncbi:clasp N terminal-domain-containing protein [Dichomitus squalens]|uniref:Clasp N terminal-domain-containing protein n=1 Tax=Dichomitus squalens TaxID=114155 RepID=A0A4Q9QA01_9APHY|nr:clasp N terminal-domain-containing protein [Dichomitus squalens]
MPAKAPLTSIECYSLSHLIEELAEAQDALSVTETEESWDSIANALSRFAALCNGNANTYPADLVAALRASSRPITSALSSERTRLSGTATDFITTAVIALGSEFEPLIPHYLPALFTLCTRTNKVFLNRAKACIAALVEHTQAISIIHYSFQSISDKSISLRLAAAETMLLCLKSFNPPDLEKESRAKEIEGTIRAAAVDANADVRKVARKIFDAYKILLPRRVQSFTDPLTPRTRKYLDIKATTAAPRSQPPSRPTSSQSVRSNHSDTHPIPATSSHPSSLTDATAQRPTKHVRSASASQATAQIAPKRPARAPTPDFHAPSTTHEGARRPAREEPRRLKVNMPPPDYIPARPADTGPQRPMSATELHFPAHHTGLERPPSGPQRVIRPDAAQPGGSSATNAARTGPIRPAVFAMKSAGPDDGMEKKERVVGGARRVLRMPEAAEPAPHAGADEKGKAAAAAASSRPVRPRVISTSRSTPAIPLQSAPAREDAARARKLASSVGASARGGASTAAPTAAPTARLGRMASAAAATQATAGSRARASEKAQDRVADKDKPKTKVPSKPSAAPRPGPGTSVTVRDRTNRAVSKSKADPAKPSTKDSQKTSSKPRSSPEVPEAAETVSPAEVPLPESPKLAPDVPPCEASPPPLISFDTPDRQDTPPAAPERAASPAPADAIPSSMGPTPNAAEIPIPAATPGELTPTPVVPSVNVTEPSTPTRAEQPYGRRTAEVEQTPISALVASIQRGFLSMHGSTPLSPMREEDESVLVVDESESDGKVFAIDGFQPVKVEPLFSKPGVLHA